MKLNVSKEWFESKAHLEDGEIGAGVPTFVEFRKDGWPLCPKCGEDELFSNAWNGGSRPSVSEFLASGLKCLKCGWSSPNSTKGM